LELVAGNRNSSNRVGPSMGQCRSHRNDGGDSLDTERRIVAKPGNPSMYLGPRLPAATNTLMARKCHRAASMPGQPDSAV